jgi:hypothetical protein
MTAERVEGVVQVVIMLAIGAMAGAASFTHVHDVTVAHGQPNWIGWANAVVVELMSIALGLELRRRARNSGKTGFVTTALLFFVAVSLAAQVVDAERSVIGWLAAALPAIGFLVLAKVVLSRTAAVTTVEKTTEQSASTTSTEPASASTTDTQVATPATAAIPVEPVTDGRDGQVDEFVDEQAPTVTPAAPSSTEIVPASPVPTHLLPTVRFAVVNHEQSTGRRITVDELAARMSITPVMAGQLLDAVVEHDEQATRINGTRIGANA